MFERSLKVHQGSLNDVLRKLQKCLKKVSRVSQRRLKSVSRECSVGFNGVSRKFKGCLQFKTCFKSVLRKSVQWVSRVFQ